MLQIPILISLPSHWERRVADPRIASSLPRARRHVERLVLEALWSTAVFLTAAATMRFVEHLEELRRRLTVCLAVLGSSFALCVPFAGRIFAFLMTPLRASLPEGATLIATQVPEVFLLYLKMSFFVGIFVASPVILWQAWLFVAPALHRNERRLAIPFVLFGTSFFVAGAVFAHTIVFPYAARFLVGLGGEHIEIRLTVSAVFAFYSRFLLGMGLVFQVPTAAFLLSRLGLITARFLVMRLRYALLINVIVAALITPTGDPVTLGLVAVPMMLLYLVSIGVAWFFATERD